LHIVQGSVSMLRRDSTLRADLSIYCFLSCERRSDLN